MTNIFSNLLGRIDNGDFLFSKILKLFIKRATGGLFNYFNIVSKKEKQKKRSSSSKFEGINGDIKFLSNKIFKDQDSSKFTGD